MYTLAMITVYVSRQQFTTPRALVTGNTPSLVYLLREVHALDHTKILHKNITCRFGCETTDTLPNTELYCLHQV